MPYPSSQLLDTLLLVWSYISAGDHGSLCHHGKYVFNIVQCVNKTAHLNRYVREHAMWLFNTESEVEDLFVCGPYWRELPSSTIYST